MNAPEKNNWDRRYDQEDYFYGHEPNHFVGPEVGKLPVGRGLFLAEGEGRNAVHAARLGHSVTALDNSWVGQQKAQKLAQEQGTSLDYRLCDLVADPWDMRDFDFVVLCFAHLPPELMGHVHAQAVESLRPGGRLIHCSFAKSQFGRKSGGPPRLDWLHDLGTVQQQYAGVEFDRAVEHEVELNEAAGHRGLAMVIEISGTKKTG
nr:class I SAM-dependent methyltransferase [Candidatus Krumholzibacteria bacterium]